MSNESRGAGPTMPGGFDPAAALMRANADMTRAMLNPYIAAQISLLNWHAGHCKRMAQAYSQWFDFIGYRLEADAAFAEKLQDIEDPDRMSKACSKFLETAAKDYQREVAELTRMTSRMADEATNTLQEISVSKETGLGAVLGE